MTRTIALTGATGFVGSHLVDLLVDTGHRVKALTRRPQPARDGVEWVSGSLEDAAALKTLATGTDTVIHVAGLVKALNRQAFMETNRDATVRFLNTIHGIDADVKPGRFILISSLAAREPHLSYYSESKRAGEDAVASFARDLDWVALRPPAIYGPGDLEILKLFKALNSGFAPVIGKGRNRFSMIHVLDLASAIVHILDDDRANGLVLELDDGTANGYAMDAVLALAEKLLGRSARHIPVPDIAVHVIGYLNGLIASLIRRPAIFTGRKARELVHPDWVTRSPTVTDVTGWTASLDLETGLAGTFAWYRDQGLL